MKNIQTAVDTYGDVKWASKFSKKYFRPSFYDDLESRPKIREANVTAVYDGFPNAERTTINKLSGGAPRLCQRAISFKRGNKVNWRKCSIYPWVAFNADVLGRNNNAGKLFPTCQSASLSSMLKSISLKPEQTFSQNSPSNNLKKFGYPKVQPNMHMKWAPWRLVAKRHLPYQAESRKSKAGKDCHVIPWLESLPRHKMTLADRRLGVCNYVVSRVMM